MIPQTDDDHQSHAEELLELGKRYQHTFKCKCEGCAKTRKQMEDDLRPDILDLIQKWADASAGVQFRGLMEGWTDEQIAEALNLKLQEQD
jgi:hypothetical protein